MIGPLDSFVARLREKATEWEARTKVSFYIADGILTTTGTTDAVCFVHSWASRWLLSFITLDKLSCVASSRPVLVALQNALAAEGFEVARQGDILGVDYSPGKRNCAAKQLGRFAKSFGRRKPTSHGCGALAATADKSLAEASMLPISTAAHQQACAPAECVTPDASMARSSGCAQAAPPCRHASPSEETISVSSIRYR